MFISNKQYNKIMDRLDTLERQNKTQAIFLHNDYVKLKKDHTRLEHLEKAVGKDTPTIDDSGLLTSMLEFYSYRNPFGQRYDAFPRQKLSLSAKVSQIMDHLGLAVVHTEAETKLEKKPAKKAAKKPAKKGKK